MSQNLRKMVLGDDHQFTQKLENIVSCFYTPPPPPPFPPKSNDGMHVG